MNKTKYWNYVRIGVCLRFGNKIFDWTCVRSKLRKSRKVQFIDLELIVHHALA